MRVGVCCDEGAPPVNAAAERGNVANSKRREMLQPVLSLPAHMHLAVSGAQAALSLPEKEGS